MTMPTENTGSAAVEPSAEAMKAAKRVYELFRGEMPSYHFADTLTLNAVARAIDAAHADLRQQIETLKDALHTDKSGMAHALAEVVKTANGYRWAAESRGPYEWDDKEFYAEMGRMTQQVYDIASNGLALSGNLAHALCCGRTSRRTIVEELKERVADLEAAIGRLREADKEFSAAMNKLSTASDSENASIAKHKCTLAESALFALLPPAAGEVER